MPAETLLQTFFTRLGFQTDTKGLDEYKDKLVDLSSSLLKLSGVASLSLGGLFEFTRRTLEPMANVAKLSETYAVATDTLAAFGRMGREVGIDTNVMMNSIGELSRKMGEVASPAAARLRKLTEGYGLSVQKAGGDVRVFLGDVAERMKTLTAQEQVNLVTKMGLDPSMVRILRNGREEFEKLYDVTSKGLPFTEDDYKKAERFQIEFAKARAAVGVMTSQIALSLMPAFQKAMESFLNWWRENGERVMERIKYWVGMFADWLGNMLKFLGTLTRDTDVLSVAMKVLGAAVAIIVGAKLASWATTAAKAIGGLVTLLTTNPATFGLLVGITALGALVALVIDDFQTWKEGGVSVIGTLMDYFDRAKGSMTKLREVVTFVVNLFKSQWESLKDAWGGAFDQMGKTFKVWWPDIKDALILIGTLLGAAAVAVVAFVAEFLIFVGKVVEGVGKVLEWIKLLETEPRKALEQLADYLWSLIDKFGDWLRAMSAKGEAAIRAWFSSILDAAEKWINDLLNGIGEWIGAKAKTIVAAFVAVFTAAIDAIKSLFSGGIMAMLDSVGAVLQEWWDKWIGKITGVAEKVKGVFGKASTAAAPLVSAAGEYVAPPILETGKPTTGPLLGPNVGGKWLDTSQSNSNNTTQNNTFNVQSMDEAIEGAGRLQQDLKRQQQQTPLMTGPQLVW